MVRMGVLFEILINFLEEGVYRESWKFVNGIKFFGGSEMLS